MFTVEQIKQAHSKVRSGADFPAFVRDIRVLGVTDYTTYVADGHTAYNGAGGYTTSSSARYDTLIIAGTADAGQFRGRLKAHQQGQTDYLTFCMDCAKNGIGEWRVRIAEMTCTYYDKAGHEVLVEMIPQ